MSFITDVQRSVRNNTDKRMFYSSLAATAFMGVATFVAVKTGVKPLAKALKVASKGSTK